jgi:GNAT superfamily N-acetyltransferase
VPPVVSIRRASSADAPIVAALIASVLADYGIVFEPEGRDADVACFGSRPDHDALVAVRHSDDDAVGHLPAEQIVGMLDLGPHGDPGVGWISKLFVARAMRRQKIGAILLSRAHELAKMRGYTEVRLRTRDVFEEARAFYAAHGYQLISRDDPTALVLSRAL